MDIQFPSFLTTLTELISNRELTGTLTTAQLSTLSRNVQQASSWFERNCQRSFVPYQQTRYFDAVGSHIKPMTLDVDEDLLSVGTLINGNASTLANSDYVLQPNNMTPAYRIRLKQSSGLVWTFAESPEQAISVNGMWGYHEHYAQAWETVDALVGTLDASGTLAIVSGGTLDANAVSPRFGVFDYVQVDNEMALITAITGSTLTLRRGVNGTTAGTHANGADVAVYQQAEDITRAVTFLAGYYHDVRDVSGTGIQILDFAMKVNRTIAEEIIDTKERYKRREGDVL